MDVRCVVGIDSGGSHTRALCVGLDGRVLGSATTGGGSPTHNADAREHVQAAVSGALASAGSDADDVVALAGGLAAFEDETDYDWARDFVEVDGLNCPISLVNDAVVAQIGAFAGNPGIIVVAGTGSMILGIAEAGDQVSNDKYNHYAGWARHLSFDAMARLLVGEDSEADAPFVQQVLEYWNVADKRALRRSVLAMNSADRNDVKRFYGGMAPIVTGCAEQAPLASESCRSLVRATSMGVRLLAQHFTTSPVSVGLVGGLATCPAFKTRMVEDLTESTCGRVQVVPTILDPVGGAVLVALQQVGIDADSTVIERLKPSNRPAAGQSPS